jgi:hypothetical protein
MSTMSTGGMGGTGSTGDTGGSSGCNPPAPDGSFYATSSYQYGDAAPTSMCDYRGDVLLVVNTADA